MLHTLSKQVIVTKYFCLRFGFKPLQNLLFFSCLEQPYSSNVPLTKELAPMEGSCPVLSLQKKWYPVWEANHYFFRGKAGQSDQYPSDVEPFTLMLPPPNITGSLHLGHALTATLQDVLVRWHGMQGRDVLWVPGCDHAGIATQVVLEQHLLHTTGKNRHQLGQDEFLREAWKWKESKEQRIYDQLRKLGVALDWDRAVFTMSESMSRSVTEAFIRLYDKGLIYRKPRPVNYCPALQSVISDIEVDHWKVDSPTEVRLPGHDEPVMFGQMVDVAYPLEQTAGRSSEHIVVSTTRPETIPADTAIMVHPDDSRYAHLVGRRARNPCRGGHSLPIIADTAVDPTVGTGAVKVTPGLSATDHAVGQRHALPVLDILHPDGTLDCPHPALRGLPRLAGRRVVIALLQEAGLLRAVRPHQQTVPRCSRTGDVVETLVQRQWFVRVREMADRSREAVLSGELEIEPPSRRNVWTTWMLQTRAEDWCISRQIWWGHQVPMYRISSADGTPLPPPAGQANDPTAETWVAAESRAEALQKAALQLGRQEESLRAQQDSDVLDTWFSSALFPFAALGWPRDGAELARYYPTSALVTGQDILFFWVARMVMLGTELTGQLPFKKVLLHGLVCDSSGAKMSKSRGNVIDPMALIEGDPETPGRHRPVSAAGRGRKERSNRGACINSESLETKSTRPLTKADRPVDDKSGAGGRQLPVVGPDALRMSLMSTSLTSDHVEFGQREVEMWSALPNKMWHAVRFLRHSCVRAQCHHLLPLHSLMQDELQALERWVLHEAGQLVGACEAALHTANVADLTKAFSRFWRSVLCDVFLEAVKPIVAASAGVAAANSSSCEFPAQNVTPEPSPATRSLSVVHACMVTALLCIAPVMPHVAEELYHRLPHVLNSARKESIFAERYPEPQQWSSRLDEGVAAQVEAWLEVVTAVRNLKASHNIPCKDLKATLYSTCPHLTAAATSAQLSAVASQLAQISSIQLVVAEESIGERDGLTSLLAAVGQQSVLHLHVPEVDVAEQKARLEKREQKLNKQLSIVNKYERSNVDKIEKLKKELLQVARVKERLESAAQR